MKQPLVSIIIATYNSEETLPLCLDAIKQQSYPQSRIEVLLMDGGSTDQTLKIAQKYQCKIIPNPRIEPVYAKYLGFFTAKGDYAIYLDSDEVMVNKNSIKIKIEALEKHGDLYAITTSGYLQAKNYPFANQYINEFGDPFSFFIYRLSKDERFYRFTMMNKYPMVIDEPNYTVFDLRKITSLPILELVAMGSMINLRFFRKKFPQIKKHISIIPHLFYLLHPQNSLIAISKNDPLIHYSSASMSKYLSKIAWRVKNNIHHAKEIGGAAFLGREKLQSSQKQFKKYLFLPYAFSIIFPLSDAVYLMITRKSFSYLWHLFLVIYTAILIIYHYILKILKIKFKLKNYGSS